jgi:hypothetical protein
LGSTKSNSTVTALWRLAAGEVSTKGIILSSVLPLKMKQEKLLRHILEAVEASALVTRKVNLRELNPETSRGVEQLREAEFIKGTFHEIVNAPLL